MLVRKKVVYSSRYQSRGKSQVNRKSRFKHPAFERVRAKPQETENPTGPATTSSPAVFTTARCMVAKRGPTLLHVSCRCESKVVPLDANEPATGFPTLNAKQPKN